MSQYVFTDKYEPIVRQAMEEKRPDKSATLLNIACEFRLVPSSLPASMDPQSVWGVEINRELVAKNPKIKYGDVDKDRFPFDDATFDFAYSEWGMEHFQSTNIFQEVHRVLKPGGRFIFVTPNLRNTVFWVSKYFGEWIAGWYYKNVLKSDYHPHKAFYRFNTGRAINRVGQEVGFAKMRIVYFGPAGFLNYFRFSPLLQKMHTWMEKWILTNALFYWLKPYLVVVLEKEGKALDRGYGLG